MSHNDVVYKTNAIGELFNCDIKYQSFSFDELNTASQVDFIFSFKFGLLVKRLTGYFASENSIIYARVVTPIGFFKDTDGSAFVEVEVFINGKVYPTFDKFEFMVEKSADEV